MKFIFHTIFFEPLYNALVFLSGVIPGHDLGLAVIVLTILVRLILFPLQHRMSKTQFKMKMLEPELKKIKEETKEDRAEQAKKTMELYRQHGVNPFFGIVALIIQLPILLALFWVFKESFDFDPDLIYSFITPPGTVNTHLFGLFDVAGRNAGLAVLTGVTQFFQMRYALPPTPPAEKSGKNSSFRSDLARSFSVQMRYVFPVLVVFIALSLPGAIALYWVTSNLFALGHELFVKRRAHLLGGQAKNLSEGSVPKG